MRRPEAALAVVWLGIQILLVGCSPASATEAAGYPTYDPFLPAGGAPAAGGDLPTNYDAVHSGPTPTLAPLSVTVPPRPLALAPITPTPDSPRSLPTPRQTGTEYVVQPGDTLVGIAQAYGVSLASLLETNDLSEDELLELGSTIVVPPPEMGSPGPAFKIIPDSELVYGPAAAEFDVQAYLATQGGFLSTYNEVIDTSELSGAEIIERVAEDYSVNPRLLLALLEHQSQWVSAVEPGAASADYPLGLIQPLKAGLYRQLSWAANELNRGYYLWRANAVGTWVLNDGEVVPIDPTINAGTAGVQNFFSALDNRTQWEEDVNAFGLFQTYFFMFENPFDRAIEPLVPATLQQPGLILPFDSGVAWAFTGGPHAAWDAGSGWGALDFAPPDVMGCAVSQEWVTAAADGYIVRSAQGAVVQDMDGDGYEQTGWSLLYMHIFEQDRVQLGTYTYAGQRIGHPSCEGGISNASHLHFARKYNGEWIAADGTLPFALGGWTSSGDGQEYDGFLRSGSTTLEAQEGIGEQNRISR